MATTRPLNNEDAHQIFKHGVRVEATTAIMRTPRELYDAWRSFSDVPRIVDEVESVACAGQDGATTHWRVRLPTVGVLEWDAEIINDQPGKVIAWRTTEDAGVVNAGSVRFRELPADHGTEMRVVIEYVPPGKKLGEMAARAANVGVEAKVRDALHRFRQVMEAGEVSTSTGQPAGINVLRSDRPGEKDDDGADRDVRDIEARNRGAAAHANTEMKP